MRHFMENLRPKWKSFKESMYLLAKNKLSLAAFIIMLLLIFAAILAPVIAPYPEDVNSTHIEDMLLPPSPLRYSRFDFHSADRGWHCAHYWGAAGRNRRHVRRLD